MKTITKITSLLLSLLLTAGASSCTQSPADSTPESTPTNKTTDTAPEPAPEETTEPFDMPPETNELVVYSNSMTKSTLTAAVEIYKDKYPDVKVTYENISDDAYEDIIKTELAAGAGPDVVFTLDIYINDIYKLMLSSIFMNLDGFMDSDDSFNKNDYIKGVFDSGILNGKRCFVPIEFSVHSALTTQEILDEEGLTLDEVKTFDGFIDSIYNYTQKYASDPEKSAIYWDEDIGDFEARNLIESFGSTYIDYENNKVTINDTEKDSFRRLMDGIHKIYDTPAVETFYPGTDQMGLIEHKCLYADGLSVASGIAVIHRLFRIVEAGKTPIVFLPQNPDGTVTGSVYSFAAIPEGANNKLNAYNFLKILLSDEFQGGEGDNRDTRVEYLTYCPVRKDAVYKHITGFRFADNENPVYVKAVEDCAELMMNVDNAVLIPTQVWMYIRDEMTPYFAGDKDYDTCYDRLINVLTLYKDE